MVKSADILQRQVIMYDVLRMLLFDRQENGKPYFLKDCVDKAGISVVTWYKWVDKGYLTEVMQTVQKQVDHYGQTLVMGRYQEMTESLMSIAIGEQPTDELGNPRGVKPTASALVEAQKLILEQYVNRIGGVLNNAANPHQFLQDFQPQQVHIHVGDVTTNNILVNTNDETVPDFVYRGNGSGNDHAGVFLKYDEEGLPEMNEEENPPPVIDDE